MRHIISVLTEHKHGVLARISGLFSARGFNIESLSVAPMNGDGLSNMIIVVNGDDLVLEQVTKQLNKLIDVIKVQDLTGKSFIDRELALLKINSTKSTRPEIMQIVNIFKAKIVDISPRTVTVEATGSEAKIQAIIGMLKPFGIKEEVRTGKIAMSREFGGRV